MTTWGDLRTQLRRSILKDSVPDEETGDFRWDDLELRDFCWWALESLAQHTAAATASSYQGDGETTEFDLPDNLFTGEKLDITGLVYTEDADGDITYLDPIKYTDDIEFDSGIGFYTHPDLKLHLTDAPGDGTTLHVRYFAFYNNPYADDDTIDVPRWMLGPLAYLIGAHAMTGAGLKSSFIRQWGAKPDTGTPEHNPIRAQQKWFLEMFEREMAKHSPQDRTNFFRVAR